MREPNILFVQLDSYQKEWDGTIKTSPKTPFLNMPHEDI